MQSINLNQNVNVHREGPSIVSAYPESVAALFTVFGRQSTVFGFLRRKSKWQAVHVQACLKEAKGASRIEILIEKLTRIYFSSQSGQVNFFSYVNFSSKIPSLPISLNRHKS